MNKALLSATIAGMLTAGLAMSASADDAMSAEKEKCYGIAKAGENSCKAANGSHSCAGQSTKNNDKNDWKLIPKGTCTSQGGTTEAPTS